MVAMKYCETQYLVKAPTRQINIVYTTEIVIFVCKYPYQ